LSEPNPRLKFLLDESVPDSVARALRAFGHEATVLRESGVARGSPDQVVATFAEVSDSILVALDGDMKQLAKDNGFGHGRFKKLNLLKLSCAEPAASGRVTEAMSLIEHEWNVDRKLRTRRLFVEIAASVMRTWR
jgi:predicted nuclease of predicted toxin-antitoxin system